jgi:hypothetical protein
LGFILHSQYNRSTIFSQALNPGSGHMTTDGTGAYGADDKLVDYILGITFEIWEQRKVGLIHQYYDADIAVYALDGITRGASGMVDGTNAMLAAYPDRLLLVDDVIWSGTHEDGYYSSHRIVSPMTNKGPTLFGPATGKRVRILTIADCVVENGVITGEWLIRDNHALVAQLGHDPVACARVVADRRSASCCGYLRVRLCAPGAGQQLEYRLRCNY